MTDDFKSLADLLKDGYSTQIRIVEETTCNGCGQVVIIKEMPVIGGECRGELRRVRINCRCEDNQLAKQAKDDYEKWKIQQFIEESERISLITPKIAKAEFETYKPENQSQIDAFRQCLEFAYNFKTGQAEGLVLFGSYGVGKSHLASATRNNLLRNGYSCAFYSIPSLFSAIKASFDSRNGSTLTEQQIMKGLASMDCVILDDLGSEQMTEWKDEKLFEVLNMRQDKATIITTNFDVDALRGIVDGRNLSRIIEGKKGIRIVGDDYRMKGFNL